MTGAQPMSTAPGTPRAGEYAECRDARVQVYGELAGDLTREECRAGARDLGMLDPKGLVVLPGQVGHDLYFDHCLHDLRRADGLSVIERRAAGLDPEDATLRARLLRALARSRFSVFQVQGRREDTGVEVLDLLTRTTTFVHHPGLSRAADIGVCFAARTVQVGDMLMTTEAVPQVDSVVMGLAVARSPDPVLRLLTHASAPCTRAEQSVLAGAFLWAYLEAERADALAFNTPCTCCSDRPTRNARCPCGSGRRYRKCCGRR